MRKATKWLAVLLVCLGGCAGNMISVDAIEDSVAKVAERHDAYVNADATLSAEDKALYLRTTEILRGVMEAAKAP